MCVCGCVRACVRVCVRACMRARVCVCVCVCVYDMSPTYQCLLSEPHDHVPTLHAVFQVFTVHASLSAAYLQVLNCRQQMSKCSLSASDVQFTSSCPGLYCPHLVFVCSLSAPNVQVRCSLSAPRVHCSHQLSRCLHQLSST